MADESKTTKAAKAEPKPEIVRLTHPDKWTGTLACGETEYAVKDGVVNVAPEHITHAEQAGFRAA